MCRPSSCEIGGVYYNNDKIDFAENSYDRIVIRFSHSRSLCLSLSLLFGREFIGNSLGRHYCRRRRRTQCPLFFRFWSNYYNIVIYINVYGQVENALSNDE